MEDRRFVPGVTNIPARQAQEQLYDHRELIQAIRMLNNTEFPIFGENSRFHYALDSQTGRPVIKVIDHTTDAVLYQLPPDYVLELAKSARKKRVQKAG